nr:DUF6179 domain-containing protein [bacterium]
MKPPMNKGGLIPRPSLLPDADTLSPEELAALEGRLWQLLAKASRLYTQGDSSSIRLEMAQELFTSICFVLSAYLRKNGLCLRDWLHMQEDAALEEGTRLVEQKVKNSKRLYQAVCLGLPGLASSYLADTMREIGLFFTQYNPSLFAHQIPCMITYPLEQAVPENTLGIDYIAEYLRRIMIENHVICRFPLDAATRLLDIAAPGYGDLPLNLYQPILANAIALTLLERPPFPLMLTWQEGDALMASLRAVSPAGLPALLEQSAARLCHTLAIQQPGATVYLRQSAANLAAPIGLAMQLSHLNGVFYMNGG